MDREKLLLLRIEGHPPPDLSLGVEVDKDTSPDVLDDIEEEEEIP